MEDTIDLTSSENETDNSNNLDSQEPPVSGDNSQDGLNKEPETNIDGGVNQNIESKFKTFEEAVKSHAELEKKLGEQSSELGELRKKAELAEKLQKQIDEQNLQAARDKGFETIQDFTDFKEAANLEANEYQKHLNECEFPDEMLKLLAQYRDNPTAELLNTIEAEFSTDTVKKVAGNVAILKGQLQQKRFEAQKQEIYNSAKEYLDMNVNKYREEFKNPAFAQLYGKAFEAYGCDLNTDLFVNLMHDYANSIKAELAIEYGINLENKKDTDKIANLANGGVRETHIQEKNILDMSEAEMRKELQKYN